MDFAKAFALNADLELNGQWFTLTNEKLPDGSNQEVAVKIARTNNDRYRELLRQKLRPVMQSLTKGFFEGDAGDPILIEVMAKTIVLDWRGFTENGQDLPYSVKKAEEMLTRFKEFRNWVAANADDMRAYKEGSAAASQGNLPVE